MKKTFLMLAMLCVAVLANAQEVKNVILLIPDGCSLATVSASRWYQWYMNPDKEHLAIDPYLSGTVRTTCSNAPIGDSAPTTSCYMTGYLGLAGWVSTYPTSYPKDDIYPLDKSKEYQPLATVLEAAKILKRKSTGLVFTCEFPHATPADCASHSYNRNKFEWIAPQMAHNDVNVVIGGGTKHLNDECEQYLKTKGWGVFRDDVESMRTYKGNNMWALFTPGSMPYDIDRDKQKLPSLAEMTSVAINKLSNDPDGFFLMVEGSAVDFAAHNNDPAAMVTEFLAFDEACRVAFDFAKRDGNTAVVVVPDHGNSGISIGRRDWGGYARDSKDRMFKGLSLMHASCEEMATKLNSAPNDKVQDLFKEWCGFTLTEKEMTVLNNNREYKNSPIARDDRHPDANYRSGLARTIAQFMTERTGFAFTTNGHTGEDVFLASYHPQSDKRPYGMLTNVEINHYLCSLIGIDHDALDQITDFCYAPHTDVFEGLKYEIRPGENLADGKVGSPVLVVKGKKGTMTIKPFTNEVTLGKSLKLSVNSPSVYVDKNNTFYVSRHLRSILTGQIDKEADANLQ